jgi:integrase
MQKFIFQKINESATELIDNRIRENSQLDWTAGNVKHVREQLDKIVIAIKSGQFRFAEVFPSSRKKDHFSEKERQLFGSDRTPGQVNFAEYAEQWYELLKSSERVSKRTLWGYNSYIENYLVPYFGELTFSDLNKAVFDQFVLWAKNLSLRRQSISNETINKIFVPMKMICKDAAIACGWQSNFNPFFGFKRLPEGSSYENIQPFTLAEQARIIRALPIHW